jgi:uncharacterized delta-60 repeat protein
VNVAGRAIAAALLLCGGVAAAFAQELSLRQPDGKIVTLIDDKGAGGPLMQWIERRNPDGSLDLAFGDSGRVTFSLKSADILEPLSLSLDAQGRLVLAGAATRGADRSAAAVSRFLPDGRADLRWGTQGSTLVRPQNGLARAVDALAMPDQGMLMLGRLDTAGSAKVVLWRLRFDGTADASFGRGGVLQLPSLDGAQPTSLRPDDEGAVWIASQRAQSGSLLLEVHRWQPGTEELRLIARQAGPPDWRGPVQLERRNAQWWWTDTMAEGSLPLLRIDDPASLTASLGQASFSPFATVGGGPQPMVSLPAAASPSWGWLGLLPLCALGFVPRWWRGRAASDPELVNTRVAMIDAALANLERTPRAPAGNDAARPNPAPETGNEAPLCHNALARPMFGAPDDLKRIKGIGPVLEKRLHREGIFYFWQLAQWRAEDVADIASRLSAFKGRIERDRWVAQARELAC